MNTALLMGNILGSLLAASALRYADWGWAFIVNGVLCMACGLLVYAFLVARPSH